jgi:hypothetical protein
MGQNGWVAHQIVPDRLYNGTKWASRQSNGDQMDYTCDKMGESTINQSWRVGKYTMSQNVRGKTYLCWGIENESIYASEDKKLKQSSEFWQIPRASTKLPFHVDSISNC